MQDDSHQGGLSGEHSVGPADSRSAVAQQARAQETVTGAHSGETRRRRRRPPKLYRIGEVVDYSGVSRQTIHNYTTMGLLRESSWTRGGHRLYDDSVFDRLDEIVDLKADNKSLQEIREHFERRERC
ncbi:MAG: MerR family transcriptional regulator [Phycisphaerae bacterium]